MVANETSLEASTGSRDTDHVVNVEDDRKQLVAEVTPRFSGRRWWRMRPKTEKSRDELDIH